MVESAKNSYGDLVKALPLWAEKNIVFVPPVGPDDHYRELWTALGAEPRECESRQQQFHAPRTT